ncbi:MAG: hypothetical protein JXA10_13715 [Anaerolineae bacterium]|nr:hypothetical protein [Anaerolineae bacterium]
MNESGTYRAAQPDEHGEYHTPKLPRLAIHVPTFWQDDLPDFFAVGQAVKTMLT